MLLVSVICKGQKYIEIINNVSITFGGVTAPPNGSRQSLHISTVLGSCYFILKTLKSIPVITPIRLD